MKKKRSLEYFMFHWKFDMNKHIKEEWDKLDAEAAQNRKVYI